MNDLYRIWVYLSGSPLFALFLTLLAYDIGCRLHERSGRHSMVNPVAIAVAGVVLALWITDVSYPVYFSGAQFVHFLLGTATVAMALPIWRGWTVLRRRFAPMLLATIAGGAASMLSAYALATLAGLPDDLLRPLYVKSVTAPIAMGVADNIHAAATLAAVYAVITGISGAIAVPPLLRLLGVAQDWQRGLALGVSAHGIGTSAARSESGEAALYASVGMVMHGVLGALLIPWVLRS